MTWLKSILCASLLLVGASVAAQAPPPDVRDEVPPKEVPTVVAPGPVTPVPAVPTIGPGREIRIGEHFALKLGLQAQVWANTVQDINPAMMQAGEDDYQNSIFLRRARVLAGVRPWDNIELFLLVEGSDLGKPNADGSAKNAAINILDAWGEIKFHDAFIVTAGLQLVPVARNVLQATTTYLGLDIGNTSAATFAPGNPMQTATLRDPGLQIKGTVLGDKLEYRAGVFSGVRDKAVTEGAMSTQSENWPRLTGYLQYNFLDVDKGYVFNGTYYGKKNILGVAAAVDYQKGRDLDAYRGFSGALFAAIPIFGANPKTGADEIAGLVQWVFYDGRETAPTLLKQHGILAELAYFNRATKLSVFGKYEEKRFVDNAFDVDSNSDAEKRGNLRWYGGGVKYHLLENLCNFTFAYNRAELPNLGLPDGMRNSVNQFTLAAQILYY